MNETQTFAVWCLGLFLAFVALLSFGGSCGRSSPMSSVDCRRLCEPKAVASFVFMTEDLIPSCICESRLPDAGVQ